MGEKTIRTTMTIAISAEDKKQIKIIAAEKGKTVSAIIHEWIAEYGEKEKNQNG